MKDAFIKIIRVKALGFPVLRSHLVSTVIRGGFKGGAIPCI